ncbi:XrtA/PEP-CTERM system TPR-repeat protein PrsT [Congregibacter sp.]|uniref:XrtA/PEP-CTERM system TPR-repeat protein PrsT n=1 Tax=Congregibacter sp. TaxID=2744308 RepID=UPI0039E55A89
MRLRLVPPFLLLFLILGACSSPLTEDELLIRASTALAAGDVAAAELDVKTALQQNPNSAAARSLYGKIYLRQMDPLTAAGEFERSLAASASKSTLLLMAQALVQAGESAELLSEYDVGAYFSISSDPEFQAVLARAYLGQVDYENARAALVAADDSDSDYTDVTRAMFALQLDKDSEAAKTLLTSVVKRSPENAHALSVLGILATREGDRDAAEEYFSKASKANPYRLGDRLQLVDTQIRLGKDEAADRDLAQLEKLIPNYPVVNFLRGQLYFDDGEYENAISAFSQVLTVNPQHPSALLLSANANVRTRNLSTARRQFTQFLSLQPGHRQASLGLANVMWQLGEPDKTESIARDILKEHVMDIRALGFLAMALSAQGMNAESAQVYSQIAELQPESIEARMALGSQQVVAGDAVAGIEQLEAAVNLDPTNSTARERLIAAQLSIGNIPAAEEAARAYKELTADSARSSVYLGRVLLQSQNLRGARAAFDQALTIDPGNVVASGGIATLEVLDNNFQGAIVTLESALRANPGDLPTSMNLAIVLEQTGELEKMQQTLQAAMASSPQALEPRLALARAALGQNRPGEAINLITPVVDSNDRDYRVHQLLAGSYLLTGQPEAAESSARRLYQLRGQDPEVLVLVARVEAANGRLEVAELRLAEALEAVPNSIEIRKMLVEVLIKRGKREQAADEVGMLPVATQNEADVVALRGRLALSAGDAVGAKALFEQAFEQARTSTNLALLTTARWSLGERSEAIGDLERWVQEYPDDLLVLSLLASRQVEAGNSDEARRHYGTLVQRQPENVQALNNLAWFTRETNTEMALDYIARADKLAPQSPQVKDTYAMVELERGEYSRALALNDKALEGAPGDPDIRFNRAQILMRAGRSDEAREVLAELAAGPAFASQAAATELLQSL